MRLRSFALALVFLTTFVHADERKLIDRLIDAYGGREAIRKTTELRETGVVSTTMRAGDGRVVRTYRYPDKLRVDIAYGAIDELRILNGTKGSRDGEAVDGPQLAAMILQAGRMSLPYLMLDRQAEFAEDQEIDRGGKRYRTLRLMLSDKMAIFLEVDPDTMYVVRSVGVMENPASPGRNFEFITDYADYRRVDGVLFAFVENSFAGGRLTGKTQLEKIEIGPALGKDVFTPSDRRPLPQGHPDVPRDHPLPPGHPPTQESQQPKTTPV